MANDRATSLERVKKIFETEFGNVKREDIKSSEQLAMYEKISRDFKVIDLYMHTAIIEFEDRLNRFLKLIDYANLTSTARGCYEHSCEEKNCVECTIYEDTIQDIWPEKAE